MKTIFTLIASALSVAVSGCASTEPLVITQAVGPLQSMANESATRGSLMVYSDTDGPTADPSDYAPHSNYKLYAMDGYLLQSINNRGVLPRDPATVSLPVGQYKITARSLALGLVTIPIVIEKDRTTVVDLNREVVPSTLVANENWVRLPNGQIVGSKSE